MSDRLCCSLACICCGHDLPGAVHVQQAAVQLPLCIVPTHVQVWGIEAVEAVLDFKWRTWAKHLLWAELGAYVIWLAAFQVFVLLFQASHAATAHLPTACSAPGSPAASSPHSLVLHRQQAVEEPCACEMPAAAIMRCSRP